MGIKNGFSKYIGETPNRSTYTSPNISIKRIIKKIWGKKTGFHKGILVYELWITFF